MKSTFTPAPPAPPPPLPSRGDVTVTMTYEQAALLYRFLAGTCKTTFQKHNDLLHEVRYRTNVDEMNELAYHLFQTIGDAIDEPRTLLWKEER